jgi:thiosulfate/3-mercaptopyruvate sulfurtransferase
MPMTDKGRARETGTPGPLVSPEWLAQRLGAPDLLVLDIRSAVDGGGRAAYEAGHIPGAVHTDYVKDGWRAVRGSATGLLPQEGVLSALFARLGIEPGKHVVVVPAGVSAGDFSAAARVYWTLKVAGHERLSILDGGFSGWAGDPSRPVETGFGRVRETAPYPVRFNSALRATLEEVERAIASHSAALLDSRSASYFEGREKSPQARVPGRLPGAFLLDHTSTYDASANRLKPRDELDRLFAPIPRGGVVNYCNTGQQAATTWFVLSEVLGRPGSALYDGSMSEWTEDPARPVETGPAS